MNPSNPRRGHFSARTRSLLASAVRRPVVEGLESRVLMHGGDDGVEGVLAAAWVPWVTPASTTLKTPALGTTTPTPTPTPTGTATDTSTNNVATVTPALATPAIRIDVGGT